jgi:hypothetical protein
MEGPIGPTGIAGVSGREGVATRGPTGPVGPTGFMRYGFENFTGPTGPAGATGPREDVSGNVYTLSVYSTGATGTNAPSTTTTPATLWEATIPSGAKGKKGYLSVYFDMTTNYLMSNSQFDYGLYIDDVPVSFGPTPSQRYVQTIVSSKLLGSNGIRLGEFAPTPLAPLTIPVTLGAAATSLQLKAFNANSALSSYVVSTPSNFTTVGSNAYTTPAGSIGVLVYAWGCGGSAFESNAGGPGGFTFGYYPCAAGTVMTAVVGGLGTNTFLSGFGGTGLSGTVGAGGGFSALFLGATPTSTVSTPIVVAGGGGGTYAGASGSNFTWVGGGGGGTTGRNTFRYSTLSDGTGTGNGAGGTQVGAGSGGNRWSGAPYSTAGAGGGGYYGGGRGDLIAGGGGSGFVNVSLQNVYMPAGLTAIAAMSTGAGSRLTATGSNIMAGFGYSPNTYAHGGGGTGLVIVIPVTGSNTPFVGVDAQFSTT